MYSVTAGGDGSLVRRSLVQIFQWHYGMYTRKAVQCFLIPRSNTTLGLGMELRLGLGLGPVTFRTSEPSD